MCKKQSVGGSLPLTLLRPAFFGSLKPRGEADLPPPSKKGDNWWEVQKLSWNLISLSNTEIDVRQKDLQLSDT